MKMDESTILIIFLEGLPEEYENIREALFAGLELE